MGKKNIHNVHRYNICIQIVFHASNRIYFINFHLNGPFPSPKKISLSHFGPWNNIAYNFSFTTIIYYVYIKAILHTCIYIYIYIIPKSWVRLAYLVGVRNHFPFAVVPRLLPSGGYCHHRISNRPRWRNDHRGAWRRRRWKRQRGVARRTIGPVQPGVSIPKNTQQGCYNIYLLVPLIDHTLSVWVVEVWMENGLEVG